MPILWGYECRPIGGAICIPSQPQRGCEVIGDTCTNHYAGGDLTDGGNDQGENEQRAKSLRYLYETGQICRLE